ncbi:MAG: T9SS type A sorting domain-containing protein [Saprospiraceae bacterium]|nr:T9SS type A sorting domain-containing protein [Saprospiraceae bacterium]
MKSYFTILQIISSLFLINFASLYGQGCPLQSVTLSSQVAVENFVVQFPDCREIVFPFTITGDVTDLRPLLQLRRVNSNLNLRDLPNLESLNGLDSVSFITSLNIRNTGKLRNLRGLEQVRNTFILEIVGNQVLETTEGLNLDRLPNNVTVQNNASLILLTGVNSGDSISSLSIINNPLLKHVTIWDSLKVVRNNLVIDGNFALREMNGLNRLEHVAGAFRIEKIDSIEYLPDFDNLEYVGKELLILGRTNSTSYNIAITKNIPKFKKLKTIGAAMNFRFLGKLDSLQDGILNELESTNEIRITSVSSIIFSGFHKLKNCGTLEISACDFSEISGFDQIEELQSLNIDRIYELKKFGAFKNLRRVNGKVNLYASNVYLESFEGLANLEYVGGDLQCISNRRLRNIGTKNLKYVGGQLHISDADQMKSLDDLSNLEYIGKEVYISLNDSLADVRGLERVDYKNVTKLTFRYNNFTKSCVNNFFCDFLENKPEEMSDIRSNGAGCSSREEVLEQCRLVSTTDIGEESVLTLSPNPAVSEIYLRNTGPQQIQAIVLYDLSGRQVLYQKAEGDRIDVSRLGSGVYQAVIHLADGQRQTKRLVKMQ